MESKTILIAYQDDLSTRSPCTFSHGIGYRVEAVECAFEKIERENLKERFFPFLIPRRVPA